jgi:hypothetical protein
MILEEEGGEGWISGSYPLAGESSWVPIYGLFARL